TECVNDDQVSLAHMYPFYAGDPCGRCYHPPLSPERSLKDLEEEAMKNWRNIVLALALLVGSVAPAFAQFDRGAISGTIKDEQGGVMPGVTVTVTNTQTQQAQTAITNGTGFYTFPNLLPGRYDVVAELTGFQKTSRQNVPL